MDLTQKTTRGIIWAGTSNMIGTGLTFVITAVLARLLLPTDFGLMGILMVVINFVVLFSDFGLATAIIQEQKLNKDQLSTFFFLSIGMGVILYLLCFLSAGLIAQFFKKMELIQLLKVISVSFLITAVGQTFRTLLQKDMDFKSLFKIDLLSSIFYGVISITLAIKGFGVWSLVYGFIVRQVINTLFSFLYCGFKPCFVFDIESIRILLKFGIYVFGERIVNYFNRNLDYIIIGRFLGMEALGYYTLAYNLMLLPISKIAGVVSQVVFPAFSKIQDDNERIRKGYLKVVKYITVITFPIMAILYVVAPEFIKIVYGSKWALSAGVLQILCVVGAFQSIGTTVGSVLYAKGRSDIGFKWNCFAVCCYATAFFIGLRWGINGVASMYAIFGIVLFPIIQGITNKLIDLEWKVFFNSIKFQLIGALLIVGVSVMLKHYISIISFNHLYNFIILTLFGITIYSGYLFMWNKKIISEGISLVRNM